MWYTPNLSRLQPTITATKMLNMGNRFTIMRIFHLPLKDQGWTHGQSWSGASQSLIQKNKHQKVVSVESCFVWRLEALHFLGPRTHNLVILFGSTVQSAFVSTFLRWKIIEQNYLPSNQHGTHQLWGLEVYCESFHGRFSGWGLLKKWKSGFPCHGDQFILPNTPRNHHATLNNWMYPPIGWSWCLNSSWWYEDIKHVRIPLMDADPKTPQFCKSRILYACRTMFLASQSKAQHLIDPSSPALSTRLTGCFFRHKVEMNVVIVIIATNCHMVTSCMCVHIFIIYIYIYACVCVCVCVHMSWIMNHISTVMSKHICLIIPYQTES